MTKITIDDISYLAKLCAALDNGAKTPDKDIETFCYLWNIGAELIGPDEFYIAVSDAKNQRLIKAKNA